jgi:electron transfer flavoprotein alpha subunit
VPDLREYNGLIYRDLLERFLGDDDPRYICVAHSSQGLDFAPALAVALQADCITGIEDIYVRNGQLCVVRPICGGKVVAHVKSKAETSILAIQPGIFKPAEVDDQAAGSVEIKSMPCQAGNSQWLGIKQAEADTSGIAEVSSLPPAWGSVMKKIWNLFINWQRCFRNPRLQAHVLSVTWGGWNINVRSVLPGQR